MSWTFQSLPLAVMTTSSYGSSRSDGTKDKEVDKLDHGLMLGGSRCMFTKSREPCRKLLIRKLGKDRIGPKCEFIGICTPTSCYFDANEFVADRLKSGIVENCFDECLSLQIVFKDSAAPREERNVWICSDPIYCACTQANRATRA